MNVRLISRTIIGLACLMAAGCGDGHQVANAPLPQGSVSDQIKAVQADPKLTPQEKEMVLSRLEMQQARAKAGPTQ